MQFNDLSIACSRNLLDKFRKAQGGETGLIPKNP